MSRFIVCSDCADGPIPCVNCAADMVHEARPRLRLYPMFKSLYVETWMARIAFFLAMAAMPALGLLMFLMQGGAGTYAPGHLPVVGVP